MLYIVNINHETNILNRTWLILTTSFNIFYKKLSQFKVLQKKTIFMYYVSKIIFMYCIWAILISYRKTNFFSFHEEKKGKTLFYNEVSVKLFFTMSLVPVTCHNIASSHFYSMSFGRLESVKKQACTVHFNTNCWCLLFVFPARFWFGLVT